MRKILKFISVILWMFVIYYLSSQNGSESSVTSFGFTQIIYDALKTLIPNYSIDAQYFLIHYVPFIRKLAHFSEFFILGVLMLLLIKEFRSKHPYILSSILCFIYACSDEIHQLFIENRYCSFKDVMIDTCGAIIGIYICYIVYKKWKKSV